jgi:hypothetical protein
MKRIINFLNSQTNKSSSLVIGLSWVIEKNINTENHLIFAQKVRDFLKSYLRKEYPREYEENFAKLFELEPSHLISSSYNSIVKNYNESPSVIAIEFVKDFIVAIPDCIESIKILKECA